MSRPMPRTLRPAAAHRPASCRRDRNGGAAAHSSMRETPHQDIGQKPIHRMPHIVEIHHADIALIQKCHILSFPLVIPDAATQLGLCERSHSNFAGQRAASWRLRFNTEFGCRLADENRDLCRRSLQASSRNAGPQAVAALSTWRRPRSGSQQRTGGGARYPRACACSRRQHG